MTEIPELVKIRKLDARGRTLLAEFKAPRELVEAFDFRMKSDFSSRSEALQSFMRAFLEGKE